MNKMLPPLIPAPKSYTGKGECYRAAVFTISVDPELLHQGRALRDEIVETFGESVLAPGSRTEELASFKTFDAETAGLVGANFRAASVPLVSLRLEYRQPDIKMPESSAFSGFTLESTASGITLVAAETEAAAAAAACLLQLLHFGWDGWRFSLPECRIEDYPSMEWRGLMLDCARHFLPIPALKKLIRTAWLYRINRLHWHLSDDQGWRIELLNLPGAAGSGSTRPGGDPDRNGYYTQTEIRDIVAFAAERGITVVPELDLPGHVQAVLAAYPALACTPGPHAVRTQWGISEDVLCMGNEDSLRFARAAWDEVCELFPGPYVHIGGDECPTVRWESCPRCAEKKKTLGLKNWVDLHGHFVSEISRYLEGKGKKVFGWDEVLDSTIPGPANVVHWRQWFPDLGHKALEGGRDLIRSPFSPYYLDFVQTEDRTLSPGLAYRDPAASTLRRVYEFDPLEGFAADSLLPDQAEGRGRFLGIQANAWSEYMRDPRRFEYMIFPRLLAVAETAWNGRQKSGYDTFYQRLNSAHCYGKTALLQRLGINFCPLESGR